MDMVFSTTPQILFPFSPTRLRSSSTCLGRDFLLSSDYDSATRHPGLRRNRRRVWSYGGQWSLRQQKRVVVTGALSSGTLFLGVAVVSVSVAAVVMFDSMQRRKRAEEVQRDSNEAVSQRSNKSDKVHAKRVLDLEEVDASEESQSAGEKRLEEVEAESTWLLSEAHKSIHEESVYTEASEEVEVLADSESMFKSQVFETIPEKSATFVFRDVVASDMDDSVHWEKSGSADLPVVFPVISDEVSHDLSSLMLFNGQVHMHVDGHNAESRSSMVQLSCISTSETSGDKLEAKQDELERSDSDFSKDTDLAGDSGFFKTPTRADLYTLFEENKLLNGASSSDGLAAISSNGYSVTPKPYDPLANGKSHTAGELIP